MLSYRKTKFHHVGSTYRKMIPGFGKSGYSVTWDFKYSIFSVDDSILLIVMDRNLLNCFINTIDLFKLSGEQKQDRSIQTVVCVLTFKITANHEFNLNR